MAEYHVCCGAFNIYAGTIKPNGTEWRNKSNVTNYLCYSGGKGRLKITGVRWADDDVWSFLKHYGCEANPLYKQGYKRIGCIGCPMSGSKTQKKELAAYPKIRQNYIRAFDRMIAARIRDGFDTA